MTVVDEVYVRVVEERDAALAELAEVNDKLTALRDGLRRLVAKYEKLDVTP